MLNKNRKGTSASFNSIRCYTLFFETNHISILTSEITRRNFLNTLTSTLREKIFLYRSYFK
jgi:hypothetical protein